MIDWSTPDSERDERLRQLARLLSAPLRHDDGTEWTTDDYFRDYLRTDLEEPEGTLLPEGPTADSEPIWHGHGYELDDDTFEFPLDLTSRQYFDLHARLHAERDWPHRHRRLHANEEQALAKELRIPLAQLRTANAKAGMFDLTGQPVDEQERQERLLGLARQGNRCVYTLNANGRLRTMHQVPTEDDLLALPAHAASILWCTQLWFYLERKPGALVPATLEAHNAAIQQLTDHPEQRERVDAGYVVHLTCRQCLPRHHALADPAETYDSSRHLCVCGHDADHHLVGFFLVRKLRRHDARCTECGCVAFAFRDHQGELATLSSRESQVAGRWLMAFCRASQPRPVRTSAGRRSGRVRLDHRFRAHLLEVNPTVLVGLGPQPVDRRTDLDFQRPVPHDPKPPHARPARAHDCPGTVGAGAGGEGTGQGPSGDGDPTDSGYPATT